ncbi:GNAT family N-acetyltransferase [Telmatobacter bradus]|uniref:GNAT family N-acetyltransferase n=1 Tax=Telmatobacter bradus TaxID=474953 RepID=UPI003B4293D2
MDTAHSATTQFLWKSALDAIDWKELEALYRAASLGSKSAETLRTAFSNSTYRLFVYDGARLVGAGRALADGADCSYLCDVALLPDYQGKGLGKQLVERLVELSRGHRKILLYSVRGKEAFYHKLGFRKMTTAMAIFQNQEEQIAEGYLEEL